MNVVRQVAVAPVDLQHLDQLGTDALVLALFADQRPLQGVADLVDWRLCGELSRWIRDGQWSGMSGEQVLMPGRQRLGAQRLFIFGLGEQEHYAATVGSLGPRVLHVLENAGCRRAAIALPAPSALAAQALRVLVDGAFEELIVLDEDGQLDALLDLGSPKGGKNRK